MKYYNTFFMATIAILFSCCADNVEKSAQIYLTRAEQSFKNKQYGLAKLQLDSIKLLYPDAVNTRYKAASLLLHVDLAEQHQSAEYIDSVLNSVRSKLTSRRAGFFFDKDPRYQEFGLYYIHEHHIEKNIGKSFVRPQTDEHGNFSLVSFLRGKNISHHTLRFIASDGTFAETSMQSTPHVYSDAYGRTERGDFAISHDHHLAQFIHTHQNSPVKVELIGKDGTAKLNLSSKDATAVVQVAELSKLLQAQCNLEKEHREVMRRIEFLKQRIRSDSIRGIIEKK